MSESHEPSGDQAPVRLSIAQLRELVEIALLRAGASPENVAALAGKSSPRSATAFAELPPPHSITSSARASNDGGIVRPSAFAVLMLMTSSNRVGCATARSAGFAPFNNLMV